MLLTVVSSTLLFVVITWQIVTGGVLVDIDWAIFRYHFEARYPQWDPAMETLVRIGQRAVSIPVALAVALWLAHRTRSWRPVLLLLGSMVVLSGAVGVLKIVIGRAKGETGSAEAFTGGLMYPSGHSANTVVLWGVLAYLLLRYGGVTRVRLTVALAAVPSVVVAAASTFIRSHWVTDIVAGWLVGAVVLALTIEVDRRLEAVAQDRRRRGGDGPPTIDLRSL